jgi:hypothetical protein
MVLEIIAAFVPVDLESEIYSIAFLRSESTTFLTVTHVDDVYTFFHGHLEFTKFFLELAQKFVFQKK